MFLLHRYRIDEHDFILNRVLNSHVRQNGLIRKQFLSILLTSFMSSG